MKQQILEDDEISNAKLLHSKEYFPCPIDVPVNQKYFIFFKK